MFAQLPNRALGPVGLHEIDRDAEHRDYEDDGGVRDLPYGNRNHDGNEQDDDEGIHEEG